MQRIDQEEVRALVSQETDQLGEMADGLPPDIPLLRRLLLRGNLAARRVEIPLCAKF